MKTDFEMVKEFHQTYGQPVKESIAPVPRELAQQRLRLIMEEHEEVLVELRKIIANADKDRERQEEAQILLAKELADLLYVVHGTAVSFGINLPAVMRAVHESNMSKLGADGKPIYREDGKVLKGPNYFEPDVKACLNLTIDGEVMESGGAE